MESITYGGVKLDVIVGRMASTVERSSDNVDALYTRDEIEVDAWFNPASGSFDENGATVPGNLPGLTYNNVKEILATSRLQLTVVAGGSVVLSSPKAGFPCDALNGPIPDPGLRVSRMHGIRTWAVHFKVVTYRGFEDGDAGKAILISNRWGMVNDIDEHQYSTRLVEGVAEFRVDGLEKAVINADSFRHIFAGFTPRVNFKRIGVQVNAISDGSSVHYRVIDREQYLNLGGESIATKIDGEIYAAFSRGGIVGSSVEQLVNLGGYLNAYRWGNIPFTNTSWGSIFDIRTAFRP